MAKIRKTRKTTSSARPGSSQPNNKPTKKTRRSATKTAREPVARPGTKLAALIALLERPEGATIAQVGAKTGWQPHSVRAALTSLRKRGVDITRGKNDAGVTVYQATRG